MCVVSMVFDDFGRRFTPWIQPWQPTIVPTPAPAPFSPPVVLPIPGAAEVAELRKLIDEFKEALAAARTVDRLTNKPDCEDPDKARLLDRVADLEKRLAAVEKQPDKRPQKRSGSKRGVEERT